MQNMRQEATTGFDVLLLGILRRWIAEMVSLMWNRLAEMVSDKFKLLLRNPTTLGQIQGERITALQLPELTFMVKPVEPCMIDYNKPEKASQKPENLS